MHGSDCFDVSCSLGYALGTIEKAQARKSAWQWLSLEECVNGAKRHLSRTIPAAGRLSGHARQRGAVPDLGPELQWAGASWTRQSHMAFIAINGELHVLPAKSDRTRSVWTHRWPFRQSCASVYANCDLVAWRLTIGTPSWS